MRQVAKFEMRGPEYVPKKKPKKPKKLAAKADKALSWGGFDDQAKATEVRSALCDITASTDAVRGTVCSPGQLWHLC